MPLSDTQVDILAREAIDKAEQEIFFQPCEHRIDTETIKGKSCNSTDNTYYHHTAVHHLAGIRTNGALKPSADPWQDGTVNFSLNPNLHRFGSVRFLFDRKKVDEKLETKPMCYAVGEDIRKEAEIIDRIQQERAKQGQVMSRWRIEHELGVETPAYRSECKWYTAQPVPLNFVKEIEYWIPWKPGSYDGPTGCNVSPTHALFTAWSTGLADAFGQVREEIRQVRELAHELRVPFHVRTCYPYATLDGDRVLIFNEESLRQLGEGRQPAIQHRWQVSLPSEQCLCPSEELEGNPITLVGIARRPPRPEEILEREEEKVERRRQGLKPGAHISPVLTWEQIEQIRQLKAEGLTTRQIAERLKLGLTTVWRAYHRKHLPLHRAITPQRLQEVVQLRRQGLTYEEIGRRTGNTRFYACYLVHRAGERIDPLKAAEDLQKRMVAVTDILRVPDTIPQLTEAADKLQEISEDAALLLEITPIIPMLPEYFPSHPYQLGFRATLTEEVLRTGAWCLEQKEKSYDIREVPAAGRKMRYTMPHTPEHKALLKTCAESAADVAVGYLDNKPGYETKAAQHMAIIEEMMEEVKE